MNGADAPPPYGGRKPPRPGGPGGFFSGSIGAVLFEAMDHEREENIQLGNLEK